MNLIKKIWGWARWPLAALFALYVGLVVWRLPSFLEEQRSKEVAQEISAKKITLADVMGTNLPPVPNKEKNDSTVEGIDANNNGIRDDVELAIFEKYPNSARVRAAELQYAMALQLYFKVFSTETWLAAVSQDGRADSCIAETYPRENLSEYLKIVSGRSKEVEGLVFNTDQRKDAWDNAFDYTTSFGIPNKNLCDVNNSLLKN